MGQCVFKGGAFPPFKAYRGGSEGLGEDGGKALSHSLAKTFTHHGFGNASFRRVNTSDTIFFFHCPEEQPSGLADDGGWKSTP